MLRSGRAAPNGFAHLRCPGTLRVELGRACRTWAVLPVMLCVQRSEEEAELRSCSGYVMPSNGTGEGHLACTPVINRAVPVDALISL